MNVFRNETTLKAMDKELTELERLAEIGRYTEMAFEHAIFCIEPLYSYEMEMIDYEVAVNNTDKLIKWGREQEENNQNDQ